jgi:hypothetical protein
LRIAICDRNQTIQAFAIAQLGGTMYTLSLGGRDLVVSRHGRHRVEYAVTSDERMEERRREEFLPRDLTLLHAAARYTM